MNILDDKTRKRIEKLKTQRAVALGKAEKARLELESAHSTLKEIGRELKAIQGRLERDLDNLFKGGK